MNKKFFLFLICVCCFFKTTLGQEKFKCGTTQAREQLLEQHPEFKPRIKQLEQYLSSLDIRNLKKTRQGTYIIPVVFHILHDYGPENIQDAQVYDALNMLNDYFNLRNADTVDIIPPFQNLKANVGFEFRLATIDPNGNCTKGINRIPTYKTYVGDDDAKIITWDRSKYLNIWVVGYINNFEAAKTYTPAFADMIPQFDGLLILHDYVGGIGTSTPFTGKIMVHEIGHYFNLEHPWGAVNDPNWICGDDGVQDTPITKGHSSCNYLFDSVCTGVIENVQNLMEFSYCHKMFTLGQKDRMILALNSPVAERNQLITQSTIDSTGVLLPRPDCPPIADFNSVVRFKCLDASFNFKDFSYNDTINQLQWDFGAGANPTSTTSINPSVKYSTVGWKDITLTASANSGSNTKTKSNYIYVADTVGRNVQNTVFTFEDPQDYPNWPIVNYFNNDFKWQFYDGGNAYSGYRAIRFRGFDDRPPSAQLVNTSRGDYDEFYTPAFDLSTFTSESVYLNFMYAGATCASSINIFDSLKIYYSNNCGSTWQFLSFKGTLNNGNLINNGSTPDEFLPLPSTIWNSWSIDLPSGAKTSKTYFKFRYRSGNLSNGFYLDDLQFTSWPTSLTSMQSNGYAFNIIPNPASDYVKLQLQAPVNGKGQLQIMNLMGQAVYTKQLDIKAGTLHEVDLDTHSLGAKGLYLVSWNLNGQRTTQRLLIQ
jgi:PKD repeat protein